MSDSVTPAIINNLSADRAMKTQKKEAENALSALTSMYAQTRADFLPYLQQGQAFLPTLAAQANQDLTGLDQQGQKTIDTLSKIANNYQDSDLYKYQLADLTSNVNNMLSAQGLAGSGKGVQIMGDQTARLAAANADQKYNRLTGLYGLQNQQAGMDLGLRNTMYGRALDQVKIGQGAAGSAGNANMAVGSGQAGIYTDLGNSLAQLQMAQGMNAANSVYDTSKTAGDLVSMYFGGMFGGNNSARQLYGGGTI